MPKQKIGERVQIIVSFNRNQTSVAKNISEYDKKVETLKNRLRKFIKLLGATKIINIDIQIHKTVESASKLLHP